MAFACVESHYKSDQSNYCLNYYLQLIQFKNITFLKPKLLQWNQLVDINKALGNILLQIDVKYRKIIDRKHPFIIKKQQLMLNKLQFNFKTEVGDRLVIRNAFHQILEHIDQCITVLTPAINDNIVLKNELLHLIQLSKETQDLKLRASPELFNFLRQTIKQNFVSGPPKMIEKNLITNNIENPNKGHSVPRRFPFCMFPDEKLKMDQNNIIYSRLHSLSVSVFPMVSDKPIMETLKPTNYHKGIRMAIVCEDVTNSRQPMLRITIVAHLTDSVSSTYTMRLVFNALVIKNVESEAKEYKKQVWNMLKDYLFNYPIIWTEKDRDLNSIEKLFDKTINLNDVFFIDLINSYNHVLKVNDVRPNLNYDWLRENILLKYSSNYLSPIDKGGDVLKLFSIITHLKRSPNTGMTIGLDPTFFQCLSDK